MSEQGVDIIETDVAIIGFGPVGATAANFLGQLGVRTIVLERDPDIYARSRAISTTEDVIRIWQGLGLAERLKEDMLGDRPIDFVGADGRSFMNLVPAPRGNGHPTQMFIYQPALEQTLRDNIERFDDVTVLLGHECVRREQDDDGVTLEVRRFADDTSVQVRARYVIAADGGSSLTRAELGVAFEGRTYEDRWVVIDTKVKKTWPEVDRLRFHCDPARPAVDCPTPLGHHRWEFPVLPGDDEAELVTHECIRELLARQGIGEEHVDILRSVIYSHHVRFASEWRVGRIFLAGDAAHVMPPWIGEGMASGVRDAHNLAWKLAAVLSGELPDSVLDSYEVERQPHTRALTRAAVNFGRVITERNRFVTALRNPLVRTVMRLPLIGEFIRGAQWFPKSLYLAGFRATSPKGAGRHKADGWMIPQPAVLRRRGERLLLDDALPQGWVVLRLAGTPDDADLAPWREAGVPVFDLRAAGEPASETSLVDLDGVLAPWLAERRADTVVLRPDRFVYTSRGRQSALARPPLSVPAKVAAP